MSLYRKAKPGEIVTRNVTRNAVSPKTVTPSVMHAKTNAERQAAWRARQKAKSAASPPADLKDIWLLTAELG